METIQIDTIGLILILLTAIAVGMLIAFIIRFRRKTYTPIKVEAKQKTIRALVLDGAVSLLADKVLSYCVPHLLGTTVEYVYIKYYDHYRKMVVLMYDEEVGWVLVPEDSDNEPKFYHLHKVHIGIPNEHFVEGYISKNVDDEEIFVVTEVVSNKQEPFHD